MAACKQKAEEKAEGYGYANFIFWQSENDRTSGTPLCHIYKSCEATRTPATTGTNYEFVSYGMFEIIDSVIE